MVQLVVTFEHSGRRHQVALVDDLWAGEEVTLGQLLKTLNRDFVPDYSPEVGDAWVDVANRVLLYLGDIGATSATMKVEKDSFFSTTIEGRLPVT